MIEYDMFMRGCAVCQQGGYHFAYHKDINPSVWVVISGIGDDAIRTALDRLYRIYCLEYEKAHK